jgi:Ser/Thr protein kinase RdoA (MazF antagonist)
MNDHYNECNLDAAKGLEPFPVHYSTLLSCALQEKILTRYNFNGFPLCEFLYRGMNDCYLVKDLTSQYLFKVYRHSWRSLLDVESEIDLLQYLKANGASVSFPIADKHGNIIHTICAPEGERYAALFSYAEGSSPMADMTIKQSRITGREFAKIHMLTKNRQLKNQRSQLDLTALMDRSFLIIEPFIDDKNSDLTNLREVVIRLKEKFASVALNELDYGICHGDFHPANYHMSDRDEITIYDFDSCCMGYFAYDIATFYYWIVRTYKNAKKIMDHFLRGYQEIRKLTELEIGLMPYFGAASFIWMIATQCSNCEIFSFFVRNNIRNNTIGNLKKFVDEHCC